MLAALVAVLAGAVPPTASAATIRRTWTATISGATAGADASGTGVLVRYWAGNGRFSVTLEGLSPSANYAMTVNQGTCSKPLLLLRLPNLRADTNGHAATGALIAATRVAPVWSATVDGGAIVLRLRAGADVHCAPLTFPVATRVAVPALGIDLPVVLQRGDAFPWCNVAMYLTGLAQPGEAGVSFIYAHARTGMFLPMLNASLVNDGARMVGMKVYVWSSDDHLYTYQITKVRRHLYAIPDLWSLKSPQVWLQTSEGPYGTKNKLMVVAPLVSVTTVSHAAAHPRAKPIVCSLY